MVTARSTGKFGTQHSAKVKVKMEYWKAEKYVPQKLGINVSFINWDLVNSEVFMEFYGSQRHPDIREQVTKEDIEKEIILGEKLGWYKILIDDVKSMVTGENKTFWKQRIITFIDHPAFQLHPDRGREIKDTATEVTEVVATNKQLAALNQKLTGHHTGLKLHGDQRLLRKDKATKTYTDKRSGQEMHLFKIAQIEV